MKNKSKKEYLKEWRKKNPNKVRENFKKWHTDNLDKYNKYQRTYRNHIKKAVFDHYGWRCNCCGETTPQFLTLDHINNDGYKEKKVNKSSSADAVYRNVIKLNFPDTYQVLCWNCNCGKRMNNGICPHESAIKELNQRLEKLEKK